MKIHHLLLIFILPLAILWGWYCTLGDGLLHVTFLDVGQGDSVFIRTPHGQNILIDGGPKRNVTFQIGEELPFWDYTLDYVVLTHADADHLTGLVDILRSYDVKNILTSAQFSTTPTYDTFLQEIENQHIPLHIINAENNFTFENNLIWNTLYPFDLTFDEDDELNNQSVVAHLVYGETSFLLTGDIEIEAEKELFTIGAPLRSNILKLSHHGSNGGNTKLFLQAVSPDYAVASVGANNFYNHPHPDVLKRCDELNIPVLRTDELGSIHFLSDGTTVKYLP